MPTPPDNIPAPILYADPNLIPQEEHPATGDVYTMPDKSRKTHKPEDHLPTYQVGYMSSVEGRKAFEITYLYAFAF